MRAMYGNGCSVSTSSIPLTSTPHPQKRKWTHSSTPTFRERLFTDCLITEPESEPSLPPSPEQLRQIDPSHETTAQLSFNPLSPCNTTQDFRLESTSPSTSYQPSTSDLVLAPLQAPVNVVSNVQETIIIISLRMIMWKLQHRKWGVILRRRCKIFW